MRDTIVRRSVFIAVFWLAGSDPCSARMVSGPAAKAAVPVLTAPAPLSITLPSPSLSAPLGAPTLFPVSALPTPSLPEVAAALAPSPRAVSAAPVHRLDGPIARTPASPSPAAAAPGAPRKRTPPALTQLRAVAIRLSQGRTGAQPGLLNGFFDARAANPADAQAPQAAPLPPYIKIADKRDEAYLREVYAAARRSPTARKVFSAVEEYTGNGREPVIFELADKDGGSFTFDWEVVRLSKSYQKDAVEKAASALVHELVHVLQKGQDLPFNAIELEVEAYISQFKVARELGVKWNKNDFHFAVYRSLKSSVNGFIDALLKEAAYRDSISLVGSDFVRAEKQLRQMEKNALRTVALSEPYKKEREVTLKALRRLGYTEAQIEAYRGDEVLAGEEAAASYELEIHRVRRDLRILRTPVGRQRYLDFARRSLKEARQFRDLLNRTDAPGTARKNTRLVLPTQKLVDLYAPLPEPAKPRAGRVKPPLFEPASQPGPLPAAFSVVRNKDALWFRAVLDAVGQSPLGAKYLNAALKRGKRLGRPWAVEFYDGGARQASLYLRKSDLFQLNRAHRRMTPREFAPEFVRLLAGMLHQGRVVSYALEVEIEAFAAAFMTARELDVSFGKSHPLYAADRIFRRDFSRFLRWIKRRNPSGMLFAERGGSEMRDSLDRRERIFLARLEADRQSLKERRATLRLMAQERVNPQQQRFFRADEVVGGESKLLADQAALDALARDRVMLERPAHHHFYRRYAQWAMDAARAIHAALKSTKKS